MKIKILVMGMGGNVAGGVESVVTNLYENINKDIVKFDFLSNCKISLENEILKNGGNIYYYTMRSKSPVRFYLDLKYFFKSHNEYDYIWIHQSTSDKITAQKFIKKYTKSKIINHCHGTDINGNIILNIILKIFSKINYKKFMHFTDYMFACSQEAGEKLYGKSNKDKIIVINNGINVEKFVFNEQIRIKLRNEFNISNKFVIGHVGRLVEAKNHLFLIEIFNEIYIRNKNTVLIIVGEGILKDVIKDKIKKLELNDNIIFTGVRKDVNDLLQCMDLFLFPSLCEGLGLVLIEAQASGLHCIASANAVPLSAKITDLLDYISLEKTASYWAKTILNYNNGYKRIDMSNEIKNAKFDITDVAKELEVFLIENKY